jgi:pimeloyl-ACP methyl ester carboxylesterase
MTFPQMADDLEAVIDEKSLAPAIVLGHSVGGKTAMLVALKHPDLIDALIVVDIAPVTYVEPFLDYIRAMREAELTGARRRADIDAELAPAVPDPATRLFLLQKLVEQNGRLEWRINLEAIAANMDDLLGFPKDARCSSAAPAPTTSAAGTMARSTSYSRRPSSP